MACNICSSVPLRGVGWSYIDCHKEDSCELQTHHIWDSKPSNSVLFLEHASLNVKVFLK